MKLSEIEQLMQIAAATPINADGTSDYWNLLPRCPYKELPVSLQKNARERFTAEVLRGFLHECYIPQDFETAVKGMDAQTAAEALPMPQDSYVSFETVTAGIPAEALDKLLIRTRNTATYTIEREAGGQLAPMLYANHATEAFESAVDEYRERLEEKRKQAKEQGQKPQRRQKAGNLVSAGYYQYVISDKKYQGALTPQQNKNAYIALMTPDFFKRLDFRNGIMTYNQEIAGIIKESSRGKYTDIKNLDFPLLIQIYTAAIKANIRQDAYTITVSLPRFFREMGIEVSKGNAPDIMEKLHSFENCAGIMPGSQTVSKLFTIIETDFKNQTMTFAVPYFIKLLELLGDKNHIERKTRQGALIDYRQPYHNTLIHSTIASERNKAAVELVYLITTGLLQRGYVPDIKTYRKKDAKTQFPDRITYSTSFRSLINDAPFLRGRIQSYKSVADKNKALRRAFEKAYQLLDTKTDAAEWFCSLHFNRIIPTMTTLDDDLEITHEGRNGDYKPKK